MVKKIVEYVDDGASADEQFLKDVLAGLKSNPGKVVKLDVGAATKEAAEEEVKKLMKLKKGMGLAYKFLSIKVEDDANGGFVVKGRLGKPAKKGGKGGKKKNKTTAVPAQNIATLPPPEAIKAFGKMGKKDALNMIKATVENPALAAMVDAQLGKLGLTKEQYIALLDAELK
jgi:hypothetical protein